MTEQQIQTPNDRTDPKGGFSRCPDSFVVNQTLAFQINFCGKSPIRRVPATGYRPFAKMIKIWIIILAMGVVTSVGFYYRFDSSFSDKQVTGTYVNKNFDSPICCVEAPHVPDTLTLNQNKTLFSKYYGHGTYSLEVGSWTTYIKLKCIDVEINTHFTKSISGTPRIILNYDMNHYYEKLE